MKKNKIFLITKLKTTNVGNQALSEEIIKLFVAEGGKGNLYVSGRPMGLDGYTPRRLRLNTDPVAAIEKWSDAIVAAFRKRAGKPSEFTAKADHVKLLNSHENLRFEGLKARLRPLKRLLSRLKPFNEIYLERLKKIQAADILIYSGAGEVGDNNVFLRQLVEIRVAQKLGKKTAVVNQSVVLKTPIFQQLTAHVYGKLDRIIVRGSTSKKNLMEYGVPEHLFQLAPDSALLTGPVVNETFSKLISPGKETVGINLTPRVQYDLKKMGEVIQQLKSYQYNVVFVTNEPFEDNAVAVKLEQTFGIPFVHAYWNYQEYAALLGRFKFLISTRLHSNVLALVANTPIIPIEGNVFKTTELMQQLQYPITVLNTAAGWEEKLLIEVNKVHQGHYDFVCYFNEVLPPFKEKVKINANWVSTL
jgi:polysaccharide pyruvyl transferase WcaK-like protein